MAENALYNNDNDGDEWEWEYDETETEDIYITLVLPTADDYPPKPSSKSKRSSSRRNNSKKAKEPQPQPQQQQQPQTEDLTEAIPNPQNAAPEKSVPPPSTSTTTPTPPREALHILDLASLNPQVTHAGQTFSCRWQRAIGTDMYFAKHEGSPSSAQRRHGPPLADDAGLLCTSSIRLVAHEEIVQHSPEEAQEHDEERASASRRPSSSGKRKRQSARATSASSLSSTPPGVDEDVLRERQAEFLRRLAEIKKKRGFSDEVPFQGLRGPATPGEGDMGVGSGAVADRREGDSGNEGGGADGGRDEENDEMVLDPVIIED